MKPALLDTNVWILALRTPEGPLAQRIVHASAERPVCMATMVRAKLLEGSHRSRRPAEALRTMRALFDLHDSLPFDDAAAEHHARVAATLANAGTPIGSKDVVIAATALAHDCVVVTHNTREFGRVPGLAVEDWQAESESEAERAAGL